LIALKVRARRTKLKNTIYIIKAYTDNQSEYELIRRAFETESEARAYGLKWKAAVESVGSTARFEIGTMTVRG
jgi:hypothetical protein